MLVSLLAYFSFPALLGSSEATITVFSVTLTFTESALLIVVSTSPTTTVTFLETARYLPLPSNVTVTVAVPNLIP